MTSLENIITARQKRFLLRTSHSTPTSSPFTVTSRRQTEMKRTRTLTLLQLRLLIIKKIVNRWNWPHWLDNTNWLFALQTPIILAYRGKQALNENRVMAFVACSSVSRKMLIFWTFLIVSLFQNPGRSRTKPWRYFASPFPASNSHSCRALLGNGSIQVINAILDRVLLTLRNVFIVYSYM